jgi:hypothetical protein
VLWLVIESAVSVLLDVANAEVDKKVVVSPADELEDVVPTDMLVEESERIDSVLASVDEVCVVLVVEVVDGLDPDEPIPVVAFGDAAVVLEEVFVVSLETLLVKSVEARLEVVCVTAVVVVLPADVETTSEVAGADDMVF